ncbi:hypothetical protein AGOR_G00144080 [Albula goreensis]|uniref:Olfactomedin-like domain-containing protein n=1 Tax=Albula goreensis TaxID=1534307 RepID=A0A8T3D788_9TELE|nr:hypothetical protein AGOR_G00144080 [Albula goreensis]
MSSLEFLCVLWCALSISFAIPIESMDTVLKDSSSGNKEKINEPGMTLEEEVDNQENILTKLLGDYDKVKALSEGSDCRCKCVVRPLSRSACGRIEEGSATAQDFYTVETVTSGPDCKCACIAPPSALNPCEGDFRLKKLQDAGEDNIKLSTIMELLEGSFYGMDLLKLHSLTTKLIGRVENIEKAVSQNHTKKGTGPKSKFKEQAQTEQSLLHKHMEKQKHVSELGGAAAAYVNAEKFEERFVGSEGFSRPLLKRSQPEAPTVAQKHQEKQWTHSRVKTGPRGAVIRGITYYKSNTVEDGDEDENLAEDDFLSGDGSIDLLIEDQLLKHKAPQPRANGRTRTVASPSILTPSEEGSPATQTVQTPKTNHIIQAAATTPAAVLPKRFSGTTSLSSATMRSHKTPPPKRKYRISWAETLHEAHLEENFDGPEVPQSSSPEECKDTLATISDPVAHNTYGRNEGAWMKDPKARDDKIYVTNYYYGNNLLEFRNMDVFKQGRFTNSYKLPYNWIGTGHVVYDGAFFYNRAFSRDIIKYDLRMRYVAAWTTLYNAVFEEITPWKWRGHSDIDFAVDESGLWIVYPAIDDESFHQEAIILSKLNPVDLSIQRETSWRTGLRKDFYGNCFVVCGVLYAVDSYNQMNANILYAYDTHTNTQMVPRLPFVNNYTYTTQIDYNPKDRLLYAWDNGHQLTYNVIFAY